MIPPIILEICSLLFSNSFENLKKSNQSFLPRYTCIIMHTVSLGLNHSCLWTKDKKLYSKNNIKTKLQNWEIEMINCIHYFCPPCFSCYYLKSWPDSKMKTNGGKKSVIFENHAKYQKNIWEEHKKKMINLRTPNTQSTIVPLLFFRELCPEWS